MRWHAGRDLLPFLAVENMRQQIANPRLRLLALRQAVGHAHLAQRRLHVLVQRPESCSAQPLQVPQRALVAGRGLPSPS